MTTLVSNPLMSLAVEQGHFRYDQEPALMRFLANRIMKNDYPADSSIGKIARRTLQVLAIGVAAAAQGGMVDPNMDAANGNKPLGGTLVASNLSTFGSFYAYCSWMVLNDSFKTLSPEEQELFKSEIPLPVRNFLIGAAAVSGACSQIPMAYAAYVADKSLFFAIARFLDAGLPIRSLYLGTKSAFSNINLSDIEKKLEGSRNNLVSLLRQAQSTLLLQTAESREMLGNLPDLHAGSAEDYINSILDLPTQPLTESRTTKLAKNVLWGIGHLSNFCVMGLYGIITYHAMTLITDDESLKIFAALFVIACKFYLWKDSVSRAARQFPSDVARLSMNSSPSTISQVCFPKADAIAIGAAYAIGGFSYGSMEYFCNLYGLGDVSTAVTSIATALLAKNTFTALKDGVAEEWISRRGTSDQQALLKFHRELGKIVSTVENTCRQEWAKFLQALPEETQNRLFQDELSVDEISQYLRFKELGSIPSSSELQELPANITTPLNPGRDKYGSFSSLQIEQIED